MSEEDLKILIAKTRKYYDSIGRVWCDTLGEYIHFTSEGRVHLLYKGNRKKRSVKEQRYKMTLFPLVVPVLKGPAIIQEHRSSTMESAEFYALVGNTGKNGRLSIRVIVKRTGDGQLNYHSVMINHKK
ncbi:hypothetical protein IJI69_04425 [Candidatus Saccharibacteria bacterium]|nr:hypothetical protein [Candidatus Saccharibacteria bacterium]